jgi:hypothetical protein
MRVKHVGMMLAVAGTAVIAAYSSASADGVERPYNVKKRPASNGEVYYRSPREPFPGVSRVDPYAYQYEPRGYYPYYNSGYWRPNCGQCVTYYQHPPYWAAWGYTPAVWEPVYEGPIRRHHW